MRNKLFFMAIGIMVCFSTLSQTSKSTKGFSEVKFNYNLSFISQDPFTTKMGIGFGSTYSFKNKFFIDAGIIIKPTKKEVHDYDWFWVSAHNHLELTAFFMDIPIHANYKILNIKFFSFSLSSGPRLFYINTSHDLTRTFADQDPFYYNVRRNNLNLGLDLGFVQNIDITDKVGIFLTQHYGQALLGYSKGFESTDLNLGILYKFK